MMTETVRTACLAVARNQLKRTKARPRPADPATIYPYLTTTGKVGREVADLFATMNARSNQDEVRFWAAMVVRYGG